MKIFNDFSNIEFTGCSVVTIGTYDGIHAGHKKVLAKLTAEAQKNNCSSIVITFSPHPRLVLYPDQKDLKLIDTEEEKICKLRKLNIDYLIVVPFNKEFANISYISFVEDFLIKKLKIKKFILGKDHRLGKQREGDYLALQKLSFKYGFDVEYVQTLKFNRAEISSSKIRKAIKKGDIENANLMIGDNFSLNALVVEGKKIGKKLGFPTANLFINNSDKILPYNGVYAVKILHNNVLYNGMLNIGKNPSVSNDGNIKIETHIFNFDKNIYGHTLELFFIKRIRDEMTFENLDFLKIQLENDKAEAMRILTNT